MSFRELFVSRNSQGSMSLFGENKDFLISQSTPGLTLCFLSVIWTMSVQFSRAENKPWAALSLEHNQSVSQSVSQLICYLAAVLTVP